MGFLLTAAEALLVIKWVSSSSRMGYVANLGSAVATLRLDNLHDDDCLDQVYWLLNKMCFVKNPPLDPIKCFAVCCLK